MELYLIRHGQSTNNALMDPTHRECDPPLTELGQRQAQLLAQHLANGFNPKYFGMSSDDDDSRGYRITRLYCSPMWRALQTAQPISQALGLAPEVWIEIHEHGGIYLDHGEDGGIVGYPGKTRSEILQEFPNYVLPEGITEQGWWRDGREEIADCHARAIKVAEQLRSWANTEECIALVSHGTFIDALLKALFNQLPGYHLFYHHHNTAITRIDFDAEGRLHLRYLNRIDHLPPELIS